MSKSTKKFIFFVLVTLLLSVLFVTFANGQTYKAVYLRNGGNSDGSSVEQPIGDFKDAVRLLKNSGGTIVVCGEYSYNELILLSQISGTANGKKTITVTSVYGGVDYRQTSGAKLVVGDNSGSANMILAGDFVFENLKIVTAGSKSPRAIICNGNNVVFGEGIECEKNDGAPYISIVGGSLDEDLNKNYSITVKSGSYNNVCGSNRDGIHNGNSTLKIDGGLFEGQVSATGIENENNIQSGNAYLEINGGTFQGKTGLLSTAKGKFDFKINGGEFTSDIVCLAKDNNFEINGGDLREVGVVRVENLYSKLETETGRNETKDGASVVNVNNYGGDVQKLVEKITGDNVEINVNTEGGNDSLPEETEVIESETLTETTEQVEEKNEETQESPEKEENDGSEERKYLLGTRNRTVLVAIVLVAVIFTSAVLFAYRVVHRKK
ncbi:MAG: hypothetical protein IKU45_03980 [Clostridia bacterium]|nr:hypothetical protein [Clostridia bacterium]